MQSPIPRLCLFCLHFRVYAENPGFSDATPGENIDMACKKNVWKFVKWDTSTEKYRDMILTAETCEHWQEDPKLVQITPVK